jgi:PRTRC genetic system protein C
MPDTTAAATTITETKRVRRIFLFGTMRLDDPDPTLTPQEVKRRLSETYPDLTTASITLEKTEEKNGATIQTWQLKRSVGTKG